MIASLKCSFRATRDQAAPVAGRGVGVDLPADDEAARCRRPWPSGRAAGGRSRRRSNSGRAAGSRVLARRHELVVEPDVVVGEHRLRTARDGARGRRSGAEPDDGDGGDQGDDEPPRLHRLTAFGRRRPVSARPIARGRTAARSLGRLAATRPNDTAAKRRKPPTRSG